MLLIVVVSVAITIVSIWCPEPASYTADTKTTSNYTSFSHN